MSYFKCHKNITLSVFQMEGMENFIKFLSQNNPYGDGLVFIWMMIQEWQDKCWLLEKVEDKTEIFMEMKRIRAKLLRLYSFRITEMYFLLVQSLTCYKSFCPNFTLFLQLQLDLVLVLLYPVRVQIPFSG